MTAGLQSLIAYGKSRGRHSYLKASIGFNAAAFFAGYSPKNTPTPAENPKAITTAESGVATLHPVILPSNHPPK